METSLAAYMPEPGEKRANPFMGWLGKTIGTEAAEQLGRWGTKALTKGKNVGSWMGDFAGGGEAWKRLGSGVTSKIPGANPMSKYIREKGLAQTMLGDDPMSAAMNVGAGLEGARQGYEVGGVGGALAGGLGGYAGSRIAFGGAERAKRFLMNKAQSRMAQGGLGALRKNVGGLTRATGRGVERLGGALEKISPELAGGRIKQFGAGLVQKGQQAAAAAANNPQLRTGIPAMMTLGGMSLAMPVAEQMKQTTMDAYKHTVGAANAAEQRRRSMEQGMRQVSPDFQVAPNMYAGYMRNTPQPRMGG